MAGVLVILLIMPVAFVLSPPKKAEALLVPTGDFLTVSTQVVNSVANIFEKLKDFGLDGIAWMMAKMALRAMSAQLIDWINSGFNGNPAFISDPAGFFLNIGDAMAGEFILGTDLNFLCDPINVGISIRAALSVKHFGSFQSGTACSLSQVIANVENANLWINGKATLTAQTGWDTWLATTQVPANNIYGQYYQSRSELDVRVAGARNLNKTVAGWSEGFKSILDEASGLIETPGNLISSQLEDIFNSDRRVGEAADELQEMLTAIAGALFQQALLEGVTSLSQSSGGQTSVTNQLRQSGGNLTPYYTPSSGEQSTWINSGQQFETYGQNQYDTLYGEQQDILNSGDYADLFNSSQNPIVKTDPELDLAEQYPCTQPTTDQFGYTNYSAMNAIDNSDYTRSSSACFGSHEAEGYWQITFENVKALDEVRLTTGDSSTTWTLRELVNGTPPSITFYDESGGVVVSTALPHNTHEYQWIVPLQYRTLPVKRVRVSGRTSSADTVPRVSLREINFYQHLRPIIDGTNFPNSLFDSSTTAAQPAYWVTGLHYPFYSDDPIPLNVENISVVVRNTALIGTPGYTAEAPLASASTIASYALPQGTYRIEYTATVGTDSSNNYACTTNCSFSKTLVKTLTVIAAPTN